MIEPVGSTLNIAGPVLMENVCALRAEAWQRLAAPRSTVDLSGVTEVDSTAVALLLDLKRRAAEENIELSIVNLPANLKSLTELYGVADLLNLHNNLSDNYSGSSDRAFRRENREDLPSG